MNDFSDLLSTTIIGIIIILVISVFIAITVSMSNPSFTPTGNALTSDVLNGQTFYSNSTAKQTGSMETRTPSNSTPSFLSGYYSAFDLNSIDSNLAPANIKSGTTVFGVLGTLSAGTSLVLHSKQARCWNDDAGTEVACGSMVDVNYVYQDARMDGNVASFTTVGVPVDTVKDNFTGLIWQKDGASYTMKWSDALGYCAQLDLGGYSVGSWRLPSNVELITFADYNCSGASANCTAKYININFTQTGWDSSVYGYWSSTTVPSYTSYAYGLESYDGTIFYDGKTDDSYYGARCVRSGS